MLSIVSRDDTVEVLSLEQAKRDLDVTFDDDDVLISGHIASAIDWVENYTKLFLQPVVLDLYQERFTGPIRLPRGPIRLVTTVTVDGVAVPGFRTISGSSYAVLPAAGSLWPYTANTMTSVVRYNAGYINHTVPQALIGAVGAVVRIFYDKPLGAELAAQWSAVERMLTTYRLRDI